MRLFIAVSIQPALVHSLQAAHLLLPAAFRQSLRWIPKRNWHMTVLFLGNGFSEVQAAEISEQIVSGLPGLSAFEAPLERLDWFPTHRPVVLAALFGRNLMLQVLHDEVYQALKGIKGVKKPQNRFEPHISLARVPRKNFDFTKLGETLPVALEEAVLMVEKVGLYRSHFASEGVHYECLAEGRLARG